MESEVEAWQKYVGRTRVQRAMVDAEVLRRFAVSSGADPNVERALPPLSHWGLFLDAATADRIGPDGHPLRGDFLPPISLPRRMFANGSIEFSSPLQLGLEAECTTTIASVTHKRGQTGDLVFLESVREVTQGNRRVVSERQTAVYRGLSAPLGPVALTHAAPAGAEVWCPSPVDLFRFSAVTFNSHRIHYDRPYTRDEEGYPDLLVHGPFTTTKLLAFATARLEQAPRSFEFRMMAPLFVSQPVYLVPGESPATFSAIRCDGVVAATAKVKLQ